MNLAVNARDAMPTGGGLRIKTLVERIGSGGNPNFVEASPGEYVLLQVQDDGVGMNAETKERMFDPFFTTKPPGKGTGLGLATFYGIVKQMKGSISVDSELGRGTCIQVVFPMAERPAEKRLIAREELPNRAGAKVLVVEDDLIVRSMLLELLAQEGYEVAAAADGEHAAALAKTRDFQIDLLISDVVMPNCSGLELADRLSLLCPNLRVLFISGYFEDLALQECVRRGTASVLLKPFSEYELAARVRQILTQAA
jgi:CheY-like chemotaxis protein